MPADDSVSGVGYSMLDMPNVNVEVMRSYDRNKLVVSEF